MNPAEYVSATNAIHALRSSAACYDDDEPVLVRKSDLLLVCSLAEERLAPAPSDSDGGETD